MNAKWNNLSKGVINDSEHFLIKTEGTPSGPGLCEHFKLEISVRISSGDMRKGRAEQSELGNCGQCKLLKSEYTDTK